MFEVIRNSALPIDAAWKRQISNVPAGVIDLRQPFNIVFLAILLDALEWPDISFCSCLLRGFPLEGDLSTQTSNIFEPKDEGEMTADYERFEEGWAELQDHESNLQWLAECEQMLLTSGRKAQETEGPAERGFASRCDGRDPVAG